VNGVEVSLISFVERLSRAQKWALLCLVDTVNAPLALTLSFALVHNTAWPLRVLADTWEMLVLVALLGGGCSLAFGINRIKLNAYEVEAVLRTLAFSVGVTVAFAVICRVAGMPLAGGLAITFWLIYFLLSIAIRIVMLQVLLWVLQRGQHRTRVLIYGAGGTGQQLVAALRSHETIVPVAFLDDDPARQHRSVSGLRVYPPSAAAELARDRDIKRVLLAMPSVSMPKLAQIARRLQGMGLDVHALPSFAQLIGEEAMIDNLVPVVPGRFLGRAPVEARLPAGSEAYAGKSILVTGAGGSIGSELCRQLLQYGPRRLVLFDVSEIGLYTVHKELTALAAELQMRVQIVPVLGSVTDSRMARAVMADFAIEVVLHAAAYKHVPLVEANPLAGLANNVLGTRTIADAAAEAGAARFILVSTDKAVRPTNVMGASKRLAELVIQDLAKRSGGTVYSMVRFGNVLGSSGSVIPLFKEQIARGGPVTLTHEDVTRYFMTVGEAARLVLIAGSYSQGTSRGGDVFVLDMGKPVRIRDLAAQMIEAAGYSVKDQTNPDGDIEIVTIGLRPGEKMHEELMIGEGLLTTPHPKILRAQEACLSELEMASALRALRTALATGNADAARDLILRYVEGYHAPSTVAKN
jgi:FlaA1/EpsC-like NDP-sugar epimerase